VSLKRGEILRLLFKSRKGLSQTKKYNKKAKEFWKNKNSQLIDEITRMVDSSSDFELVKISKDLAVRTGFHELACGVGEVHELKKIIEIFGKDVVIPDFVNYGTRTGFLTVVIAPALAAADGLGDVDEKNVDEWLYGIGICLPVSADICDSVLDEEVMRHALIPYRTWITCHKLGAALMFKIGLNHAKNIKTGNKTLDEKIMDRLLRGIKKVSEKQRIDCEVKKSSYVPLPKLEEIYDGKICEIEATVFGTLPSKKTKLVKAFESGARHLAGELQVVDDIEDLLGDPNLDKPPEVPNPSFFLTYCIDEWKSGEKNIEKIMEQAAKKTLARGEKYHKKVMEAFDKLPKKFPTRPFFEITLWYYNKVLKDKVKEFLKGKTYPTIKPKLLKILKKF
jgi:hypothetical protein